jgi:hypothetical protein
MGCFPSIDALTETMNALGEPPSEVLVLAVSAGPPPWLRTVMRPAMSSAGWPEMDD